VVDEVDLDLDDAAIDADDPAGVETEHGRTPPRSETAPPGGYLPPLRAGGVLIAVVRRGAVALVGVSVATVL